MTSNLFRHGPRLQLDRCSLCSQPRIVALACGRCQTSSNIAFLLLVIVGQ